MARVSNPEQLAFLADELRDLWRDGIIDAPTYARIVEHYDLLDDELEVAAAREQADDPPPAASLESTLDAEVAFIEQVEHHVAANASARAEARAVAQTPPEQRRASIGRAIADAGRDLTSLETADPEPDPVQTVVERDSAWSKHVRPFLYENALWFAGALLILCGSIYFLRIAWGRLPELALRGVIATTLHAYGAAFFGVGYLVARRRAAHGVARILFAFCCAILPLGTVAIGEVGRTAQATLGAIPGVVLAIAVGAAALGAQGWLLAIIAGLQERVAIRPLVRSALGLALPLIIVGAWPGDGPGAFALVGVAVGFTALGHGLLSLVRERVLLRTTILLYGGALVWSFAVLVTRCHLAFPIAGTHYATLIAALAALLITCDLRLRARVDADGRLSAFSAALHVIALGAVALALGGLGALGYFDIPARVNVLVTAVVATVLFARATIRHGRRAMTLVAAATGLLGFFFLPAPFSAALKLLHQWLSSALGYADTPLPSAYYGLAFLPYMLALAVIADRIARRRRDLAADLRWFVVGTSALLVPLALTANGDLRPALWSWPLYAIGAFVAARRYDETPLHYGGHALALACVWALGAHLSGGATDWAAPMLALYGLGLAAAIVGPWRHHPLGASAACAVIASVVSVLGHPDAASLVAATLALNAVTAALLTRRFRIAVAGHACAALVVAATAVGASSILLTAREVIWLFAAVGAVGTALAFSQHALRSEDDGWRLVARPALLAAGSCLSVGLFFALIGAPALHALVIAALLWPLATISRGATATVIAALGTSLAIAVGAAALAPAVLTNASWAAALAMTGCALALVASRIPPGWAKAARRTHALNAVALVVVAVGVIAGVTSPRDPALAAALSTIAATGAGAWYRADERIAPLLRAIWPVVSIVALAAATIATAAHFSTGRYPPAAVLALVAPVVALGSLLLEVVGRAFASSRPVAVVNGTARVALIAAAALAFAAIFGCAPNAPAFVVTLGLITLGVATARHASLGRHDARAASIALVLITGIYVVARLATALGALPIVFDVAALLVGAQIALWLAQHPSPARAAMTRPLLAAAIIWPLWAVSPMLSMTAAGAAITGTLVALHYGLAARLRHERAITVPALAFGNAALFFGWAASGWSGLLLYTVPLALTALTLVHLYGPELGTKGRQSLRSIVLVGFYASGIVDAVLVATPIQSLVVIPVLCVAGIVAGTALRVRAYALFGVAFLAVDLGANLLRYGLQSRALGALFLTALGLLLVATMVVFNLERERLVRRYSSIVGEVRTWD